MSIFNRTKVSDRENAMLWKKESGRLERERNDLLVKLESIERYGQDYEKLIDETKIVKEKYENLIVKVEKIFEEYKSKLSEIISIEN